MGGKSKPPYGTEFRQQIVALYAAGRTPLQLSQEFGCSAQSVRDWVKQAGNLAALPDKGSAVVRTHRQARTVAQSNALSSEERRELERLRKENRRLQTERDILAKATAWFANEHTHGPKGSTR